MSVFDSPQRITNPGDPPCVLHVEDDEDFSSALKRRLEAHGVAVVRAFDGQDGIRLSEKYQTDAILLDFEMPHANGDEVLAILRSNESTRQLPVIVVSGQKDPKSRQQMENLGVSAYLSKPLNFDDLRNQLARYIDILPKPGLKF